METAAQQIPERSSAAAGRGAGRLPFRRSRERMFALEPSSLSSFLLSPPSLSPSLLSPDARAFDLVPPALLVPPDGPIRGGSRTDAGVVLDRELVALAAAEARCRLVRARLAARLITVRAWRALGFVRLADFARERLGVSPRSLEDDAHVMHLLEALPGLCAALEAGALSWSRLRVLLRVATAQNEAELLEASRAVAMRDLESFVKGFEAGLHEHAADSSSTLPQGSEAGPPATSTTRAQDRDFVSSALPSSAPSDDPYVRWSIHVSRSGRRMWRAACEYASRHEGSPLSPGQVLELVAGEAAGGSVAPSRAAGTGGSATPSREAADASAALFSRDDAALPRWMPTPEMHEQRLREGLRAHEARGRRDLLTFLAETGVAEGFAWLDPASGDPGPARSLDSLAQDLDRCDAFELERRLQCVRTLSQRLDAQIAALMRTGIDRRLFREIGFATVKLYVEARLGFSARRIWSLVALERESWRHSRRLHEAFRDGRLTALQATALLPVLNEKYAEAWIQRAGEVTLRRLNDEVAWALDHSGQEHTHGPVLAPPPADADVRADAAADVTDEEVQIRAHGPQVRGSQATPDFRPPGDVRLDFVVPVSLAVLVETTLDLLGRPREARWMTFERMVALALLEWRSVPRHRDPVFERDGWRCAVPGCSSRRNLHDHHVQFRSQGGGNARDNRVTVCAAHHLHGIHAGIVRVSGAAPHGLAWELGCAAGREPLMRLRGDRRA